MRLLASRVASVLVAVCVAACVAGPAPSGTRPGPAATPSPAASPGATVPAPSASTTAAPSIVALADPARIAGWSGDLDRIVPGIASLHPDPFRATSETTMTAAVDALRARIATATDDELMTGVQRIVALVSAAGRDGHTGVFVWGTGTYHTHTLPLRLWVFPTRVTVVAALPPYEALVGRTVTAVDGQPIADVAATLDPLIPRDNTETVTLLLPRFLLTTEILHGAGIVRDTAAVRLTLDGGDQVTVEAIPTVDYNAWATPYGLHVPIRPDVPWLARSEEPMWFAADGDTLAIQYNRVTRLRPTELKALTTALADPAITRVIVDIRHNYGGETFGYQVVADALVQVAPRLAGGLFLETGRNTFSAASLFAANLTSRATVTVVGEPMGGSPGLYGNTKDVELPFSGIALTIATGYYEGDPGDTRTELPVDLAAVLTVDAWAAGQDVARAAIEGLR